MSNFKIKFFVCLFLMVKGLLSCQNQPFVAGKYVNTNGSIIELSTNGKYNLKRVTSDNRHGISPSGISNGSYIYEDGILALNSKRTIQKNGQDNLELNLDSKRDNDSKILKFSFTNILQVFSSLSRESLKIEIEIFINDEFIKKEAVFSGNEIIELPYEIDEYSIVNFTISVLFEDCIKNNPYDLSCFFKYESSIEEFGTNNFEISLPQLDISDFYYLYFKDEFIRVESNKIYWNGDIYNLIE